MSELQRVRSRARNNTASVNNPSHRHSWHLYALRLNLERLTITRDAFIEELKRRNVHASVHFIPIPLFTFFAPFANLPHNRCPKALALYPRLVSLPLYPAMTERQISYVIRVVKETIRAARKTLQLPVMLLRPRRRELAKAERSSRLTHTIPTRHNG